MTTTDWPAPMSEEAAKQLRDPFPPGMVGKLPRVTCRQCSQSDSKVCNQHKKEKCRDCGGYMTTAHIHLDYVGHAATTDRLLQVDPFWTWEPVAFGDDGAPLIQRDDKAKVAKLWIRMTVCGVTRFGVGIAETFKTELEKELISDAIRNAAMRFGVALDLWSKEDLTAPVDDTPTGPPEGWKSKDECDNAHARLAKKVKESADGVRSRWQGYLKDAGYAKPFTKPQYDELDAQLLILTEDDAHRVGPVEADQPPSPGPASEDTSESAGELVPLVLPAEIDPEGGGALTGLPLPSSGPSRVDVSEWKRSVDDEARARFDAWRRKERIPATVANWTPEAHAAFEAWIAAKGYAA